MSKERILLLGGNYFPEPTGIGKYNGEMVEWLADNGYAVTVVTTYPYYPHWKIQDPYTKKRFWFTTETKCFKDKTNPVKIIRCPHYIPTNPTGLKRIFSDFSIVFATLLVVLKMVFSARYQYVMTVAPPFQTGLLALLYKKLRNAKTLYHIQDLQIDAAHELGMIKSKRVINTLFNIEKFILRHTDHVSSISIGMMQRIKSKLDKDVIFLPNWVETQKFFPVADKDAVKESFGFSKNEQVVLYSGAIGHKQGLEAILHTAAQALTHNPHIKFVICGAGPYKAKLIQLKDSMQLNNVVFMPLQPYEKFNDFLNMADLHLVLQKAGASDLVMPSKLSAILSVGGVALVTAQQGTGLHTYITTNKIGILAEPDNQDELNTCVFDALQADQKQIQQNARTYAEKHLSIDNILSGYMDVIKGHSRTVTTRSSPAMASYANSMS